jgi:hypothetical protein
VNHSALATLVRWTDAELPDSTGQECPSGDLLETLLFFLSLFAAREPILFAEQTRRYPLERKLRDVLRRHPSVVSRAAAVRLLGKFNDLERETVGAMLDTLYDTSDVLAITMGVLASLPRIDDEAINELSKRLTGPSALVAAAAVRVLKDIALSNQYGPDIRKTILRRLTEALQSKSANRGISVLDGGGTSEEDCLRITYRGPLRRVCSPRSSTSAAASSGLRKSCARLSDFSRPPVRISLEARDSRACVIATLVDPQRTERNAHAALTFPPTMSNGPPPSTPALPGSSAIRENSVRLTPARF